jgi:transposase-like protein
LWSYPSTFKGREKIDRKVKDEAIEWYQEGNSFRSIGRRLNTSYQSIVRWVKKREIVKDN